MPSDPSESEWSDMEQDKMLALKAFEDHKCPLCDGPIEECTSPDNEGKYKAEPPTRCHKTTAAAIAREDFDQRKHAQALMLRVSLPEQR